MKTPEQQYLDALEKINDAYDNGGVFVKYTPEMRLALTHMKITLMANILPKKTV
jgi:hypothetical protein